MARLYQNAAQMIGRTPVVRLQKFEKPGGAQIFAKLESNNPGGSVKDRIARSMILGAIASRRLKPGMEILEPTSGNTGIGLALVGASLGYKVTVTMPETLPPERRKIIESYGATVILTSGGQANMAGAILVAQQLDSENPGRYFIPQQFENPDNPEAHRRTTAREVLYNFRGGLDAFVAGVGTGGTITGVGEILKPKGTTIVAVEPYDSSVLSGFPAGEGKIPGIGAGFIPKILNREVIDRIERVSSEDAKEVQNFLAKKEGLFVGRSSGAAVFAAIKVASEMGEGQKVLAVLPDTGERYLSLVK